MTKLSTVPYAYDPGLIARLLGVVLEALTLTVQGYCVYEESCIIPTYSINSQYALWLYSNIRWSLPCSERELGLENTYVLHEA